MALVARVGRGVAVGGGKGTTGLNDRIVEGRAVGDRLVCGGQGVRVRFIAKRAGATPDRRRPSHTICEAIPPPRQSIVGIRKGSNP